MDAIFSPATTVKRQVKTRARQLIITNPAVGDIHILFKGENLLLIDDVPTAPLPCPDVSRNLMGVATEIFTYTDPVTGKEVTTSVAGIAEVIVKCFCSWYEGDEAARAAAAKAEADRLAAEAAANTGG